MNKPPLKNISSLTLANLVSNLEARYIFDAAASASGAEMASQIAAQEMAESRALEVVGSQETLVSEQGLKESLQELMVASAENATHHINQIVFMDAYLGAAEIAMVRAGLSVNEALFLIDDQSDALAQMAKVLSHYRGIASVHVVSHGSAGELHIGNSVIDASDLTAVQQAALQNIGISLADGADLLIYGCDFGAGEIGKAAVETLASLTGADIAASDNATGAIRLGADWVLETTTGLIEAQLAFNSEAQQNFSIVLDNSILTGGGGTDIRRFHLDANDAASVTGSGSTFVWTSKVGQNVAGTGNAVAKPLGAVGVPTYDSTKKAVVFNSKLTAADASFLSYDYQESNKVKEVILIGNISNAKAWMGGHTSVYHLHGTTSTVIFGGGFAKVKDAYVGGGTLAANPALWNVDNKDIYGATSTLASGFNLNQSRDRTISTRSFAGDMHEYILLNRELTTAERGVLYNDLSAKWGFALTNDDMYDGDTAANGDYDFGVTGILHDGVTSLTTNSNGGLTIENTGLTSDQSIFAGHKADVATTQAGITEIGKREWKFDNDGSNARIANLTFNLSDAGLTTTKASAYVLLKSDGAGGWTNAANSDSVSSGNATFSGVSIVDGGVYRVGLDTTAPVPMVTTATLHNSQSVNVQSNEVGTAYLVNSTVTILTASDFELLVSGNIVNKVAISAANTNTALSLTGLIDGTYKLYTVDMAGNLSNASTNTVTVDTVAPTLNSIVLDDTALKAGDTATVTFTFSEAVTGFAISDIVAPNGAISNLAVTADDKVWTATYTPTTNIESGTNAISVASTKFQDAAGNDNTASASSGNYTVDTAVPTLISIGLDKTALNGSDTVTVTFTFSEAVTNFVIGDITAPNVTLSNLVVTADDKVWTATYTPTTGVEDVTNAIYVASTKFKDAAGNNNTASASSANYTVDTRKPTVDSIVLDDTALKAGDTATVTFTFSEAVTGFAIGDIVAPNGTLSNLAVTADDKVWTATYTPSTDVEDATNAISIPAGHYRDLHGNYGTVGKASANFTVDNIAPTVSITSSKVGTIIAADGKISYTITFSEAVTGFSQSDLSIQNASIFSLTGSGTTYTLKIAPNSGIESDITIGIAAGGVQDLSGNLNGVTTPFVQAVDTKLPTILSIDPFFGEATKDTGAQAIFVKLRDVNVGQQVTLTLNGQEHTNGGTIAAVTGSESLPFPPGATYNVGDLYARIVIDAASFASLLDGITYDLSARVSDTAGNERNFTKSEAFVIDRTAPVFASAISGAIPESAPIGAKIYQAQVTDASSLSAVRYSIVPQAGDDSGRVAIDDVTGAVTNTEKFATYPDSWTFTVRATDGAGNIIDQTVTVSSQDRPEIVSNGVVMTTDGDRPGFLALGDTLTVSITFDTEVAVTGTPRITVDFNTSSGDVVARSVRFAGLSADEKTALFTYTVVAGDVDDDGTSIAANAIWISPVNYIRDKLTGAIAANLIHSAIDPSSGLKVDTVAPNRPTIAKLIDDTDPQTGDVLNNGVSNDVAPTVRVSLTGTQAIAGDSVQLVQDGTDSGSPITLTAAHIAADFIDIDVSGLADGNSYIFTAKVIDIAGNESTAAENFTVRVDTNAPIVQTALTSFGAVLSLVESQSAQLVKVTTLGLENNQIVTVRLNGKSYDGTVTGNSAIVPIPSADLLALDENQSHTFRVMTKDAAGNLAATFNSSSFTVDRTPPTIDSTVFSFGTSMNDADDETDGSMTITTSGIEDGQELSVIINGVTYLQTVTANQATITLPSADLKNITDSTAVAVKITLKDAAENTAVVNQNFTVDRTPPVLAVSGLVGDALKNADRATDAAGVHAFTAETGSTVRVVLTGQNGVVTKTFTGTGAQQEVVLDAADLTIFGDGAVSVVTTALDAAENENEITLGGFTIDTIKPDASAVRFRLKLDAGISPDDGLTNTGFVILSGLLPDSEFVVSLDGGTTFTEGLVHNVDLVTGTAEITLPNKTTFDVGKIQLRLRDTAGNISDEMFSNAVFYRSDSDLVNAGLLFADVDSDGDHTDEGYFKAADLGVAQQFSVIFTRPIPKAWDWAASLSTSRSTDVITFVERKGKVVDSTVGFEEGYTTWVFALTPQNSGLDKQGVQSVTLTQGVGDIYGNKLENDRVLNYSIDSIAPEILAITRVDEAGNGLDASLPSNADILFLKVEFSEAILQPSLSDFEAIFTTADGTKVTLAESQMAWVASAAAQTGWVLRVNSHATDDFRDGNGQLTVALKDKATYATEDSAGNVISKPATLFSVSQQIDNIVLPSILSLANNTGESDSDWISQDGTLRISNIEEGARVRYRVLDEGGWLMAAAAAPASGMVDIALSKSFYNYVEVEITDIAGNRATQRVPANIVVDNTAPNLTAIVPTDSTGANVVSLTSGQSAYFKVSMDEAIQTLKVEDFSAKIVNADGSEVTLSVAEATPIGNAISKFWLLRITGADGSGFANFNGAELNLSLNPTISTFDVAGNTLVNTITDAGTPVVNWTVMVDNTPPKVLSLVRADSSGTVAGIAEVTNNDVVYYLLTLDDGVSALATQDFQFTIDVGGTITPLDMVATEVMGSAGTQWLMQVDGNTHTLIDSHDGAIGVAFATNRQTQDSAGNILDVSAATIDSFTIDSTPPIIVTDGVTFNGATTAPILNNSLLGNGVTVQVEFSEPLNVTIADINAPDALITDLSANTQGNIWTFTLTPEAGKASNNMLSFQTTLKDHIGQAIVGLREFSYRVDTVQPTLSSLTYIRTGTLPLDTAATHKADVLTVHAKFSEAVKTLEKTAFQIAFTPTGGTAITIDPSNIALTPFLPSDGASQTWKITITGTEADIVAREGTFSIALAAAAFAEGEPQHIADTADNRLDFANSLQDVQTLMIDNLAPELLAVNISEYGDLALTNLEAGATWEYSTNNGANWTLGSLPLVLPVGVYQDAQLQVRQSDSLGNIGEANMLARFTVLERPLPAPTALFTDNGLSTTDRIGSEKNIAVGGLSTQAGTTWQFSLDAGTTWLNGTGNSFNALFNPGLAELTTRAFVKDQVQVRQVSATGIAGALLKMDAFTVDIAPPRTAPQLYLVNDSGASDQVTLDGEIGVSGVLAQHIWEYSLDGGTSWVMGVGNQFSISTADGTAKIYADREIQVRQINPSGNASEASFLNQITFDPLKPVISAVTMTDTGSSASDRLTHDNKITLTATDNDQIVRYEYSLDSGVTWKKHEPATGEAANIIAIPEGKYLDNQARFRVFDRAGNVSDVTMLSAFTIDQTPPKISAILRYDIAGKISGEQQISPANIRYLVRFDKTVEQIDAGDFALQFAGNAISTSMVAAGTMVAGSGGKEWIVTLMGGGLSAEHGKSFTLVYAPAVDSTTQDTAGNIAQLSLGVTAESFVLDALAPDSATATFSADSRTTSPLNYDDAIKADNFTVTLSETGLKVDLLLTNASGDVITKTITASDGSAQAFPALSSYDLYQLGNGVISLQLKLTDSVGNATEIVLSETLELNFTLPNIININTSTDVADNVANATEIFSNELIQLFLQPSETIKFTYKVTLNGVQQGQSLEVTIPYQGGVSEHYAPALTESDIQWLMGGVLGTGTPTNKTVDVEVYSQRSIGGGAFSDIALDRTFQYDRGPGYGFALGTTVSGTVTLQEVLDKGLVNYKTLGDREVFIHVSMDPNDANYVATKVGIFSQKTLRFETEDFMVTEADLKGFLGDLPDAKLIIKRYAADEYGNVVIGGPPGEADISVHVILRAPFITEVTTTTADQSYLKAGESMQLSLKVSEELQAGAQITADTNTGQTVTFTRDAVDATLFTATYQITGSDTNTGDLTLSNFAGNAVAVTAQGSALTVDELPTTVFWASKNIAVDVQVPTISSVAVDRTSGALKISDVVKFTVNFNEILAPSSGNLLLTLNNGESIVLRPDSMDKTQYFGNFVVTEETVAPEGNLEVQGIALVDGASIADLAGNAASLDITASVKFHSTVDLIINNVPPKFIEASSTSGAVGVGSDVVLAFDKAMQIIDASLVTLRDNTGATHSFTIALDPTDNTRIVINPDSDLPIDRNYVLDARYGAFADVVGNIAPQLGTDETSFSTQTVAVSISLLGDADGNNQIFQNEYAQASLQGSFRNVDNIGRDFAIKQIQLIGSNGSIYTLDSAALSGIVLSAPDASGDTYAWSLPFDRDWFNNGLIFEGVNYSVAVDIAYIRNGDDAVVVKAYTQDNLFVLNNMVPRPTISLAVDTGAQPNDYITQDGTVTVNGVFANESWEYSIDSGATWQMGSGTSFILSEGEYADNQVQVRKRDAFEVASFVQTLPATVIDQTSLNVLRITRADKDGNSVPEATHADSVYFVIEFDNPATAVIADTFSANLGAGTVLEIQVLHALDANNTRWLVQVDDGKTAIDNANDTVSVSVNPNNTMKDVAGNALSANADLVTESYLIDNQAPDAPSITLVGAPIDTSTTIITKANTVNVTGVEHHWQYSLDGGANWSNILTNDEASFTIPEKTYSAGAVQVRQSDAAGNFSAPVLLFPSTVLTVDTQPPSQLVAMLVADTGESSTDHISQNGQVEVTAIEEDALWGYSLDGGLTWSADFDETVQQFTLADGDYPAEAIQLRQRDQAGNISTITKMPRVQVDNSIASITAVDIAADTGADTNDRLTRNNTIVAQVTDQDADARLFYSTDAGMTWLQSSNSQRFTLLDGDYAADQVHVHLRDQAGNISNAQIIAEPFTVDTVAPVNFALDTIGEDGRLSMSDVRGDIIFTIRSADDHAARVQVRLNAGSTVNAVFDAVENIWQATFVGQDMVYGGNSIHAIVTDHAGNTHMIEQKFTAPSAPATTQRFKTETTAVVETTVQLLNFDTGMGEGTDAVAQGVNLLKYGDFLNADRSLGITQDRVTGAGRTMRFLRTGGDGTVIESETILERARDFEPAGRVTEPMPIDTLNSSLNQLLQSLQEFTLEANAQTQNSVQVQNITIPSADLRVQDQLSILLQQMFDGLSSALGEDIDDLSVDELTALLQQNSEAEFSTSLAARDLRVQSISQAAAIGQDEPA